MKKINRTLVAFSAALLVVAIAFTACGKDDNAKEGKKAGQEYCDCFVEAEKELKGSGGICFLGTMLKYGVTKLENKEFAAAFTEAALRCDPDFGKD